LAAGGVALKTGLSCLKNKILNICCQIMLWLNRCQLVLCQISTYVEYSLVQDKKELESILWRKKNTLLRYFLCLFHLCILCFIAD
jgi:hypothetical protein